MKVRDFLKITADNTLVTLGHKLDTKTEPYYEWCDFLYTKERIKDPQGEAISTEDAKKYERFLDYTVLEVRPQYDTRHVNGDDDVDGYTLYNDVIIDTWLFVEVK